MVQFKRKENMISTLGFNKNVRSHEQRHMPKSQQHGREATAGGSQEARGLSQSVQRRRIWSKTKNFQCVARSSCTSVITKQLPGPSMLFSVLLKACFDTDSHRTTEGGMSLPPTPPNYTAKSFLYQNNPWSLTNDLCQPRCTILCILIVT